MHASWIFHSLPIALITNKVCVLIRALSSRRCPPASYKGTRFISESINIPKETRGVLLAGDAAPGENTGHLWWQSRHHFSSLLSPSIPAWLIFFLLLLLPSAVRSCSLPRSGSSHNRSRRQSLPRRESGAPRAKITDTNPPGPGWSSGQQPRAVTSWALQAETRSSQEKQGKKKSCS